MFTKKTWKNRSSEHPSRRKLTAVSGATDQYDVSREEGLILEEGDAFTAATMNDLETRFYNESVLLWEEAEDIRADTWSKAGLTFVYNSATQTLAITANG